MNRTFPEFIYGTAWKKEATTRLTELAVDSGFRAIDTANQAKHYSEALVGEALLNLKAKGIRREELFLQTKFTPVDGQDHRLPYDPDAPVATQVEQSFQSSLEHLHTDYIDSYLLHGPYSYPGLIDEDWEVWRAIEKIHASGKAKWIGVSNVNRMQLETFVNEAEVKPMVVQNRCYASRGWDREVREFCREQGIMYEGFSLLTANVPVLQHPPVHEIASRLKAAPTQVVFAFARQIGMVPLTGTTNQKHMQEDLAALKLELSADELSFLESIAG
jgi:diketogulonate reductase-like aldo/keto reductase